MDGLTIRQIKYNSHEYSQELELRNAVLRLPLGLNLFKEDLNAEKNDMHTGAFLNGALLGVLVLTRTGGQSMKMRQVAVEEANRRQGIGAQLVMHSEKLCLSMGIKEIRLHARVTAVAFYEKLGYTQEGAKFTEVGIPHVEMYKKLWE